MAHKRLNPDTVRPPGGNYTHSVEVAPGAKFLYVAGQTGVAQDGTIPEGIEAQAEIVFDNINKVLAASGYGIALARSPTSNVLVDKLGLERSVIKPGLESSEAYYLGYQNIESLSPAAVQFATGYWRSFANEAISPTTPSSHQQEGTAYSRVAAAPDPEPGSGNLSPRNQ